MEVFMKAYTYLIGWSKLNKYYYGVRYSKRCSEEELWHKYKTSSKYVHQFYVDNGEPDVIQIRRLFEDKIKAISWESKVLKRLHVVDDDRFLNRWDNNMVPKNMESPFPFELKEIQDKVHDTYLKKYGKRGSGSLIIKNKVQNTNRRKYGTHHTLHLEHVKNARESACMNKYGTENPFFSEEFQKNIKNPMDNPEYSKKHKERMRKMDWTERNEKNKKTNLKKYGVVCSMNTPENIAKRKEISKLYGCKCPFCNDIIYKKKTFLPHMKQKHNWSHKESTKYYYANKKDKN